MPETNPGTVVVESAGTALVLEPRAEGLPEVLHWGPVLEGGPGTYAALSALTAAPVPPSALDERWPLTVLPGEADGWSGTPGWAGHRGGSAGAVRWADVTCAAEGATVVTRATSAEGISLELRHALDAHGVLRVDASVTNVSDADAPLDVSALRAILPLPLRADEVLDLTGRWCRERSPQRSRLDHGTHLRASRRGR